MIKLNITAIKSFLNKPTEFYFELENSKQEVLYSSSEIIQSSLINAFIGESNVEVDLVEDSKEILRVYPFNSLTTFPYNPESDFYVTRIGTQRNAKTGVDHLEAFIMKRGENEIAYNIEDKLLQQLILSAFLISSKANNQKYNLYLIFDKTDEKLITTASIGKKLI